MMDLLLANDAITHVLSESVPSAKAAIGFSYDSLCPCQPPTGKLLNGASPCIPVLRLFDNRSKDLQPLIRSEPERMP